MLLILSALAEFRTPYLEYSKQKYCCLLYEVEELKRQTVAEHASMGVSSDAAGEGGTSTAEEAGGQHQQEQHEQQPASQQCSKYARSIECIYFVLRVLRVL